MHTVIQGSGALGTIFAAHLAASGESVTLLSRGKRAAYLKQHGLRVTGLNELDIEVSVETDPGAIKNADLFITTVKTYDTETALKPLRQAHFDSVFSVQNGVLKNNQLAEVFGKAALLGSAANVSGEVLETGAVLFTQNRGLYIGEPEGGLSERVLAITEMFNRAGIETIAADDIVQVEWSKFIPWSAVMALSVITRLETWKFCSDPHSASVAASMVQEAVAVARAKHIAVDNNGPIPAAAVGSSTHQEAVKLVQEVGQGFKKRAPQHRMSTLQDLLHGKQLEVEETLGHLLTLAAEEGIDAPASRFAYELVKSIDHFQ